MRFQDIILMMQRIGVAEVLLPFILVFTITFAVLQKSHIFGTPEQGGRKFNVVFSLIMALAVVFPHVTGIGPNVVPIINTALPNIAVVIVAIILFMFLIGVWGANFTFTHLGSFIVLFSVGVVVYVFGDAARWGWRIPRRFSWLINPDTQALIITILVFGLVIWYITKDPKQNVPPGQGITNFFKGVDTAFNPYNRK